MSLHSYKVYVGCNIPNLKETRRVEISVVSFTAMRLICKKKENWKDKHGTSGKGGKYQNGAKRGKDMMPSESAGKVETSEIVFGQKNNSFALIGHKILPRSQRNPPQPFIQSHFHGWLQVP